MQDIFFRAWFNWVQLFGGWGLPWSKTATATAAMAVMFYFLGIAYKKLTSKEW